MPYDYKRKQDCRQADGGKGSYVSKKKGAAHQKCWKSKGAFERAQAARHAQAEADDSNQPMDTDSSDGGPIDAEEKTGPDPLNEKTIRHFIRSILQKEAGR